jgi:glyoxylase I family protein
MSSANFHASGFRFQGQTVLTGGPVSSKFQTSEHQKFVVGLWGVRYQVTDVSRAVAFYTQRLGCKLDQENLPAFGQVSLGGLKLILSGPGASGSRPMPDGRKQEPGGWNRIVLQVRNLPERIDDMKRAGLTFRNQMEAGPGGETWGTHSWFATDEQPAVHVCNDDPV